MHFHLPKPLHGWRELLGEVGVIVIGVLIALSAEQLVETIHWRHTVDAEREALNGDVRGQWNAMTARVVMEPCVDRRLDELALVLARHKSHQPLGIIGPIGRPGVWSGSTSALQMASADQSLSHMSTDEKAAYFHAQSDFEIFELAANEERATWRTLQLLDDADSLTEADWQSLKRAYRDALDSNRTLKFDLVLGTDGQWLTPFKSFPRIPLNPRALTTPTVQDLCRAAVKH